ncbi:hypothetical protein V2J09_018448 [Rumex salicifolius]
MVKKSKKSKSKRVSLKKKHKIIRKVKEHHRKKAKEAKKLGINKKTKVEKDPGIPNDWPFKEQELKALEVRRSRAIEEIEQKKVERKERAKKRKLGLLGSDDVPDEDGLGGEGNMATDDFTEVGTSKDNSDRAFYKDLVKVIELSDVILEVLDARDPLGSRCLDMEKMVTSHPDKRLVLVLNKIDLVPREAAEKWLKYLREELPAIAFKCSTQQQKSNLGWKSSKAATTSNILQTSDCLGAETLIKLLKNYSRSYDIKKTIAVGIVGLPNVGKSSLINSLKRSHAVKAGSTPGLTRTIQEVHLDKNVKLLDCPGVVLLAPGQSDASVALRNCKRIEKLEDPVAPVKEILRLCPPKVLVTLYKIPSFDSVDDFLQKTALVRGKLKKGGVVDVLAVARIVLHDWNEGKIPYYTMPPSRDKGNLVEETKIVTDLGEEFNVDSIYGSETAYLGNLTSIDDFQPVEVPPNPPVLFDETMLQGGAKKAAQNDEAVNDDGEDEAMESKDEETVTANAKSAASKQNEKLYDAEGMLNTKMKRAQKKKIKKAKKVAASSDAMEDDADSDSYDFKVDYRQRSSMTVDDEVAGISAQIPMAGVEFDNE